MAATLIAKVRINRESMPKFRDVKKREGLRNEPEVMEFLLDRYFASAEPDTTLLVRSTSEGVTIVGTSGPEIKPVAVTPSQTGKTMQILTPLAESDLSSSSDSEEPQTNAPAQAHTAKKFKAGHSSQCEKEAVETDKKRETTKPTYEVSLDDGMWDCWRSIGSAEGLTADTAILNFLISSYNSNRVAGGHPGVRCVRCNAPLALRCTTCPVAVEAPSSSDHTSQSSLQDCSAQAARSSGGLLRKPIQAMASGRVSSHLAQPLQTVTCANLLDTGSIKQEPASLVDLEVSNSSHEAPPLQPVCGSQSYSPNIALKETPGVSSASAMKQSTSLGVSVKDFPSHNFTSDRQSASEDSVVTKKEPLPCKRASGEISPSSKISSAQTVTDGKVSRPKKATLSTIVSFLKDGLSHKTSGVSDTQDANSTKGMPLHSSDQSPGVTSHSSQEGHIKMEIAEEGNGEHVAEIQDHAEAGKDIVMTDSINAKDNKFDIQKSVVKNQTIKTEMSQKTDNKPSKSKKYECPQCGLTFFGIRRLQAHMAKIGHIAPYTCDQCDCPFRDQDSLDRHFVQQHKCQKCGSVFKFAVSLASHMQRHGIEKPFSCDVCGSSFRNKFLLKTHQSRHSDERNHCCKVCGSKFKQKGILQRHMNHTHLNLRSFQCQHCDLKFRTSQQTEKHIRLKHTGETPHKCECGAAFFSLDSLRQHYAHVHDTSSTSYPCTQCDISFSVTAELKAHILKVHETNSPATPDGDPSENPAIPDGDPSESHD